MIAFCLLSRRVLLSPVVADFATMAFLLATPAWSIDPLSPFPLTACCALIGLYMFEGGSAQFAGAFLIAISSLTPGAFYLGTFAITGFARNVWNFSKRTWSEFWSKSWVNRIVWVLPKAIFWIYMIFMQSAAALAGYFANGFNILFMRINKPQIFFWKNNDFENVWYHMMITVRFFHLKKIIKLITLARRASSKCIYIGYFLSN